MTPPMWALMLAEVANAELPALRANPETSGLRLGAALGAGVSLAGGTLADYPALATALETAAGVLRDAAYRAEMKTWGAIPRKSTAG